MVGPQFTERDNFFWLLIALVLLLFSDAVASQFESQQGRLLVNVSLLITLFVAVWSLDRDQQVWRTGKHGMALFITALMVSNSFIENSILEMGALGGCFLFLSLSLYWVWRQVLFTGAVDSNKIVGSICIYMLLGLVWAFGYMITEELFPGSFTGLDQEFWQGNFEQFSYFSMVTLTTTGYGDITPEQPVARFLAYMESITGIFYTTILVASLIGVRLAGDHGRSVAAPESGR
jgi:voltage-gated potassium channel